MAISVGHGFKFAKCRSFPEGIGMFDPRPGLFHSIAAAKAQQNVFTYSATITACEKLGS